MPFPNPSQISGFNSAELFALLLPGFLAYAVFHVIAYRSVKIEATNAVLNALGLTLLVHVFWFIAKWPGSLIPTPDIIGLTLTAIVVGIALVWLDEVGLVHSACRTIGLTNASQWTSVWRTAFRTFRKGCDGWVIVHLKDGRRLQGAVVGSPADSTEQYVCVIKARWLLSDSGVITTLDFSGAILLSASDILMVQFMTEPKEIERELAEITDSTTSPTSTTVQNEERLVASADDTTASTAPSASPTAEK
jgi:hypothetical protein